MAVLKEPSPITWELHKDPDIVSMAPLYNCMIAGQMVAWILQRPSYCDRGHWQMNSELPYLDHADGFPRYFMDLERAKLETEAWLKWRLWKIRVVHFPLQIEEIMLGKTGP